MEGESSHKDDMQDADVAGPADMVFCESEDDAQMSAQAPVIDDVTAAAIAAGLIAPPGEANPKHQETAPGECSRLILVCGSECWSAAGHRIRMRSRAC